MIMDLTPIAAGMLADSGFDGETGASSFGAAAEFVRIVEKRREVVFSLVH